ncbi:MAG: riboflavin synthase [Candidatus Hydrothermales bacterium]
MFTGIIEKTGEILEVRERGSGKEILVKIEGVDLKLGDSVSIDGVCLTVEKVLSEGFVFYISEKTLKDTKFGKVLKSRMIVNVEEPLTLSKYIGGHLFQGHVDFYTKIRGIRKNQSEYEFEFELKRDFRKYIYKKASVAIDGISLTVQDVKENSFKVTIIPYTLNKTNLRFRKTGDLVNVECDFIIKGVIDYLQSLREKIY